MNDVNLTSAIHYMQETSCLRTENARLLEIAKSAIVFMDQVGNKLNLDAQAGALRYSLNLALRTLLYEKLSEGAEKEQG